MKDRDFDLGQIVLRGDKGRDRVTALPRWMLQELTERIARDRV